MTLLRTLFIIFSFYLVMPCSAQDSLGLEKYYHKQKITTIEFLVGVNSSTIRGISPTIGGAGGGVYYSTVLNNRIGYSIGVGLVHTFSRYFELQARFLWETKGINQKTDSISLSTGTLGVATISSSFRPMTKTNSGS